MRYINWLTVLIVGLAALLSAQTDPPGRVGRLNYMDGPVSFQPAGVDDWVEAGINRPLIPGDNIWVGTQGRAELHVGSTALRLGENTAFEFLNLDDQTVQIRLSEGTLTARIRNLGRNQTFEIDTPNLAFTLLRPGAYRIDANPDSQTTTITVLEGEGEVTGGTESFPVYARQRVVVVGEERITYSLESASRTDAWDEWCAARDRREDQSQSARYVSREIAGYDDLDQYGRWSNEPGYGQVWMPTTVAAGWAPYHDGHWVWIAPWGWTWVDDAPWGFAPYHYGRWASFRGRWGWIPGPYGVTPIYAPALVGWIGGGGGGSGFSLSFSIGVAAAVGWFPLGPREPYYPSHQVSRGYFTRVNNTNTVINNTVINNYYDNSRTPNRAANIRYANRNVPNGVTAVPQDTFARGRRVTQDARAVPPDQLAAAQIFSAPAIAPRRESILGARADTSSRAARPPASVSNRRVVARTTPAPAAIPFERQQPALSQNPGRPLPDATVQQMRQNTPQRSARVEIVDKERVRRVQPPVGSAPQVARPQERRPNVAAPQRAPVTRQTPQPETRPQVERPQKPTVVESQRAPVTRQPPQRETRPQVERPQKPNVVESQQAPATRQARQPERVRPQAERQSKPAAEQQQRQDRARPEKPAKERQSEKKPNN